ncbi:hypothetical protein CDD83_8232 [Cordyceps sp. RAO-2017]|nr:hypothetical protein CDD83_8232 [Cordyceps sp. RAO-2017]
MEPNHRDECRGSVQPASSFVALSRTDSVPDHDSRTNANILDEGNRTACCNYAPKPEPRGSAAAPHCSGVCCLLAKADDCDRKSCEVDDGRRLPVRGEPPVRPTLDSQAFRAIDELLQHACSDGKTPQKPLSKAGRLSLRSVDTVGAEALYIFSPQHSSACYLYKPEKHDSEDPYQFEHVPVKAIHGLGRSAYLLAMATKDMEAASRACRESTEDDVGKDTHVEGSTAGEAFRRTFFKSHGSGQEEVPVGDETEVGASHIDASSARVMVSRVRDELRRKTQRRSIFPPDDAGINRIEDENLYLVSDEDIVEAMRLAFMGPGQVSHSGQDRSNSQGDKVPAISPSLPKLDSQQNAITPCLSAAADPATTISVPKTSFSSLGRAAGRSLREFSKGDEATTEATVVSRRSAVEVVWGENESSGRRSISRRASETVSRVIWEDGSAVAEALADDNLRERGPRVVERASLHRASSDGTSDPT